MKKGSARIYVYTYKIVLVESIDKKNKSIGGIHWQTGESSDILLQVPPTAKMHLSTEYKRKLVLALVSKTRVITGFQMMLVS